MANRQAPYLREVICYHADELISIDINVLLIAYVSVILTPLRRALGSAIIISD